MKPSPTRGLKARWVASLGIGKAPTVIILASSAPDSRYAFSNELGARTPSWLVCCSTTAMTWSPTLTGMAWVSTGKSGLQFAFAGLHDLAAQKCLGYQVLRGICDEVADDIVEQRRDTGERPNLGRCPEDVGVVVAYPENQVGEAEIGEQLPLRHQQLEPKVVRLGKVGVLGDDLRHRRHVANLQQLHRFDRRAVCQNCHADCERRKSRASVWTSERVDTLFVGERSSKTADCQRDCASNHDDGRLRWPRVPASAARAGRRARTTASAPTPEGR